MLKRLRNAYAGKHLARLKEDANKIKSLHTDYNLYPGQEQQWYYKTMRRVNNMTDITTAEILRILLESVEYHTVVKLRMQKKLRDLERNKSNIMVSECLYKIMKEYLTSDMKKAEETLQRAKFVELCSEQQEVGTSYNTTSNMSELSDDALEQMWLETGETEILPNKRASKKTNKVRCHLCRRRGHVKKNCPFSISA